MSFPIQNSRKISIVRDNKAHSLIVKGTIAHNFQQWPENKTILELTYPANTNSLVWWTVDVEFTCKKQLARKNKINSTTLTKLAQSGRHYSGLQGALSSIPTGCFSFPQFILFLPAQAFAGKIWVFPIVIQN